MILSTSRPASATLAPKFHHHHYQQHNNHRQTNNNNHHYEQQSSSVAVSRRRSSCASGLHSSSSHSKAIYISGVSTTLTRPIQTTRTTLLVFLVAVSLAAYTCCAYPSGAPEQACKDLKPGHGVEATAGAAPFELQQDKLQVEAGDQIKVSLSSPSKTTFKGLLVQAINEKGEPVGKFLAGKGLKLLESCSAVTHSDKEAKKTATLVWEAPADLKAKEAVMFKATVVHKFDQFYMNIKSTLGSS